MLLQTSNFQASAFRGLYIHPIWVFGMTDLSPSDLFSPSSCSLSLRKFPQRCSPHWGMLFSSPSPAEKCRVQPLATQAGLQAEAQHGGGDHVGLGLRARKVSAPVALHFIIPALQAETHPQLLAVWKPTWVFPVHSQVLGLRAHRPPPSPAVSCSLLRVQKEGRDATSYENDTDKGTAADGSGWKDYMVMLACPINSTQSDQFSPDLERLNQKES